MHCLKKLSELNLKFNIKTIFGDTMKQCSMCGKMKPLSDFIKKSCKCKECRKKRAHEYYLKNKEKILKQNKKWKDEHNYCNKYDAEKSKKYYEKNKDKILEQKRYLNSLKTSERDLMFKFGYCWCSKCKKYKILDEFFNNKSEKYGKSYNCKQCDSIEKKKYKKKYYEKNKDKILENSREYRKKYYSERKEYYKKYKKEYYKNNKEKMNDATKQHYIDNKKWYKEYQKEYRKTEKYKISTKNTNHNRRKQIKNTNKKERITLEQWQEILKLQNNKCIGCGREFNDELKPTLDHIIPLSKGGLHTIDNIQALCQSCNSKKGAKLNYTFDS